MNIKFLGTGGAFDFEKGNASAIVEVSGKNILIDCGFSTLSVLAKHELAGDIDYILLTHLHADHFGSLPMLLGYIQHRLKQPTPKLIVPTKEFQADITDLLRIMRPGTPAEFVAVSNFSKIEFIETTNQHAEGMRSFAYYFTDDDHLIYYSGDIGNADVAADFLGDRTESNIQVFHETSPRLEIGSHTSYKEVEQKLGKYDPYVYHIAKENMPADCTLKYVEDYPEFLFN